MKIPRPSTINNPVTHPTTRPVAGISTDQRDKAKKWLALKD
jgi:hypothetical protein